MAQKLRKHGKKLEKTSVGCHIDFTILLSMPKVNLHKKEETKCFLINMQSAHYATISAVKTSDSVAKSVFIGISTKVLL